MIKHLPIVVLVLGFMLIGPTGCKFETPEIRGVVLDEETKEPVEGAWVTSNIEIRTKTVAGDVTSVVSVAPPHLRTDKQGRFVIPLKKFKKSLPPIGFGTEVRSFGVSARTADWRGGGLEIKDQLGINDKIDVTVYIRSIEKYEEEQIAAYIKEGVTKERALEIMEGERFSSLQALYNYCLTGRFSVEVPPVESGCDEWELNYAIKKHERYLERYPKTEETRSHVSIVLEQLGLLYERKSEYEKAIEYLKKAREIRFFRPQDLEYKIKTLQQKLQQKQK